MEYLPGKKEYSPRELYESFGDKMPLIVVCTQGFLGEKGWDTIGQGSVFRFHAVSRQARVTAKVRISNTTRTISIPRSYPEKVILVGEKRERTLDDMLHHHRLPCEVGFPKERNIVMGERTINTTHLPNLTLTGAFDELHFLGFSICDGFLEKEVTAVPLYLSRVRFAIVQGARNKTHAQWKEYTKDLDDQIKYRYLTYDLAYGNPDIAQYRSEGAEVGSSEISFVEPQEYYNFGTLFRAYEDEDTRGASHPKENVVAEGEYEPVAVCDSLKKSKAYAPLPPIVDSEPEDKKADHYNRHTFSNKLYFDDNDDLYENTRLDATKHNTTKTVFPNSSAIQDKRDDMNAMESFITKDQTEQKKILVNRSSSYVEGSSSFQNELKFKLSNLKPVCRAKSTVGHEKTEDISNTFSLAESADKRGKKK